MKRSLCARVLSLVLCAMMLVSLLPVTAAASTAASGTFERTDNSSVTAQLPLREAAESTGETQHQDTDMVRVSIFLKDQPVMEKYDLKGVGENAAAQSYRTRLEKRQDTVAQRISKKALDGEKLDVVWNLTLAANILSANVPYGRIDAIRKVAGVEAVVLENRYEPAVASVGETADPNMATSSAMIGSGAAYLSGYTGAGTRIAVIDTGLDTDHQSFDAGAFDYALSRLDGSARLMTAADIADHLDQLHVARKFGADDLYVSSKVPFGYNYVDGNLTIDHDHDSQGEHGSHVAGIAAANSYIPGEDGYVSALESVKVQGVAPEAQLLVMKVFGAAGGAYDSDYMAAIEDAIVLGADSINLSLGSGAPGYATDPTQAYQNILNNLVNSDAVVTISAGNSGGWADNAVSGAGHLYADDVSMQTGGSPGSYTNSLGIASVDNDGATGGYFTVGGQSIVYNESTGFTNQPLTTLAGEREYVLIDGTGTQEDWDAALEDVNLNGRILICARGSISFAAKATAAVENGAAGVMIYNNTSGIMAMDLTGYEDDAPCVSIRQADADTLRQNAQAYAHCYVGKLTVAQGVGTQVYGSAYYTMSDFSSWGVPGSLTLKPELTTPGGSIYSVNGAVAGGKSYEIMSGTSMAAPQAAGMAALAAQYMADKGLAGKTGVSVRALSQSLLMSTAAPLLEEASGSYWSVLKQGAGLANIGDVVTAHSYVMMGKDATASWADGKVKAELGADAARTGSYTFSFTLSDLTGSARTYALDADLFTQGLLQDEDGVSYLDTATTALDADAVFRVNGKTLTPGAAADFDGDGDVDADDYTALVEYVAGKRTTLNDLDRADYDGDGSVTSYDAYLFLQDTAPSVTVPANGSVTVSVTLTLSEAQKQALTRNYPSGAYVEGYVFARERASAEGEQGTVHSIPVLGFFGDWSAASMFEVGSYTAYASGAEQRTPYAGDKNANAVTVKYAGRTGTYYFGGNPIFPDEPYQPERNAINSENGDRFDKLSYMLIRNAAAVRVAVTGGSETLFADDLGRVSSAYYYTNGQKWSSTSNTYTLPWSLSGVREGQSYALTLSAATEYSVKADGSVDWDALGEGASLTMPFTVDNTAPELLTADCGDDAIAVTARDNQYIAAAVLYNADGTEYVYKTHPQQESAGQTVSFSLDASALPHGVYLLQLYDYAMNCTTYRVFFHVEKTDAVTGVAVTPASLRLVPGSSSQLTASVLPENVTDGSVTWTSSNPAVASVNDSGIVTAVSQGSAVITATSNLDKSVSGSCAVEVFIIDKTLNGVVWDKDETVYWASFHTAGLPSYTALSDAVSVKPISAAYDENGVLYAADMSSDNTSTLYTIDPKTFQATAVGSSSQVFYTDMAQAPSLHQNVLAAVYGPYLLLVDKESGEYAGALCQYPNSLTGIAYCGSFYSTANKVWMDSYLLVDAAGNVYRQNICLYQGQPAYTHDADSGLLVRNAARLNTYEYFSAAYYDGQYLYWSVVDQDNNRANLYAIDVFHETVYPVGHFADDVWPVAGLMELGKTNPVTITESQAMAGAAGALHTDTVRVSPAAVTGSLNSVESCARPQSALEPVTDALAVSLTAQNAQGVDVASHNGKLVVRYDSANLTLTGVQGAADYLAYADDGAGRLVIAYAGRETIPAGAPVATLTFSARDNAAGTVQVLHQETDDALNGSFTETLTLGGDHSHLSLTYVPAQAAACEQDGHVEYWFCAACGRYFADAQAQKELTYAETVIPAAGHSFTTVDAKAASCTEAGNISYRLCGSCGAIQGMDGTPLTKTDVMLPALGHVRIVKNAKAATETEEGYSGDIVCARCGETLEKGRTLPKTNGITLDQALNVEGGSLEFRTNGSYPWTVQTGTDEDGETYAYAQSGSVPTSEEQSAVTTEVTLKKGQAIYFNWQASGATYTDGLYFCINGVPHNVQYATDEANDAWEEADWLGTDIQIPWKQFSYTAAADGVYTFTWYFAHGEDGEYADFANCGWLDNVYVADGKMANVTFAAGENGTFKQGDSVKLSLPVGYKIQDTDIPAPIPAQGYAFLGWFENDTDVSTTINGLTKYVEGDITYTARFAKENPEGTATVILKTDNPFKDSDGYQMWLDDTCTAHKYYSSMNVVYTTNEEDLGSISIPNAPSTEIAARKLVQGQVAVSVKDGLYDYVICYPYHPGDQYILAAMDADYPTYRSSFHFVAGEHGSLSGQTEYTAWTTTSLNSGFTPKAVADEGYSFKGWEPAFTPNSIVTGDMTYTAVFEKAKRPATIILEARDVQSQATEAYVQYYMAEMGVDEATARQMLGTLDPYDYAMLLDADATAIGDVVTYLKGGEKFALSLADANQDLSPELMNAFEYILPEEFDGSFTSDKMLRDGVVTMEIPAGTYDYIIADRITSWSGTAFGSASNFGGAPGWAESYQFESGKTYHFTVTCQLMEVDYGGTPMNMPVEVVNLEVTDTPCDHRNTERQGQKDATCTTPGYTGDLVCTDCGEVLEQGQEITMLEHTPQLRDAKDATCTDSGYTGDIYCAVCGTLLAKGQEIPALGHDYKDGRCTRCGAAEPGVKTGDTGVAVWLAVLAMAAVTGAAILPRRKRTR